MPRHVRGRYTQSNSAGDRISTVQMPMRVHIGTTWWIRCVAKMQPYVKWPLVKFWGPGPIYACRLIIMNTSLCITEYHRQILRVRWPLFTLINKYYLGPEMVWDREIRIYLQRNTNRKSCGLSNGANVNDLKVSLDVWNLSLIPQKIQQTTLCSEKTPLLFSFVTSSQINQFAQKFQHCWMNTDYKCLKIVHLFITYSLLLMT